MRNTVWPATLALILASLRPCAAQDQWDRADSATLRLPPSAFTELPKDVRRALETRGCTVPQDPSFHTPHNVVRGEFRQRGHYDWAVLCSRSLTSTVLVFWNGNPVTVDSVNTQPDRSYVAKDREGLVFIRYIARQVPRKGTIYGQKPPLPLQDGIEDAWDGKGSMVLYWHLGHWLKLQGSD